MARAVGGKVLFAMLLVSGLLHNAEATVYKVGQPSTNGGWAFVTAGEMSYDDIFENIYLVVGDVLFFDFPTGAHNVLEVPAEAVSACDTGAATQVYDSAVNVTLTTAGCHGYICGFPKHCSNFGMQLLVTVNAAPAPSPATW